MADWGATLGARSTSNQNGVAMDVQRADNHARNTSARKKLRRLRRLQVMLMMQW